MNEESEKQFDERSHYEISQTLAEAVRLGFMAIVGKDGDGQTLYRLTKKGVAEVEAMSGPN